MKKLVIVTDAWAPQINGVVRVLQAVISELEQGDIKVTVIHAGLFRRMLPLPFYPEIRFAIFPNRRMRALLATENPDYIHIATEASLGMCARRVCLQEGRTFTTSYHTNFPAYAEYYFVAGWLVAIIGRYFLRYFHRPSKAVLVSTESLKARLEAEGYGNVVVWPFGLDAKTFVRDESRAPALGLSHPLFVYVGRVAKEKSVEEFLTTPLPGSKLVIGDGPQRAALERKYQGEALFVGYKCGQDLIDHLSATDVCVFPSRTETFGLVVLEALACGLPVAAHDVLGPRDILTSGVDGALDEDLAAAATRCLSLSREDCRATAERFSWKKSAAVFRSHIETYR